MDTRVLQYFIIFIFFGLHYSGLSVTGKEKLLVYEETYSPQSHRKVINDDDNGRRKLLTFKRDTTIPVINPTNPIGTTPTTTPVTSPFLNPPSPTTMTPLTPFLTFPPPTTMTPLTPFLPLPPPTTTTPFLPLPPPTTTTAPTGGGGTGSWCVASQSASQTALQVALDYACGYGGSDCSQIQQGGSCYNPNTLRDHASYAFNSYYQKNPAPTSCNFGGTAILTNTDPSSGACQFPSSSTSPTAINTPTPSGPTGTTEPTYTTGPTNNGPPIYGSEPSGSTNDNDNNTSATSMSNYPSLFSLMHLLIFLVSI